MRYWRYLAGVESADQLRVSHRPRILAWTAAPKSARGDIVAIYGTAPIQGYVAVARQCVDPVIGSDDRHWTWLQIQPLASVLPHAVVAEGARTSAHRGLKKPAGGSHHEIAAGPGRADFLRMFARADPDVRTRLRAWQDGTARYPRDVSAKDLGWSWWEEPERPHLSESHERRLSERIAHALVRTGEGRWLNVDGGIDADSLEHPLQLGHRRGSADIVLLDARRPRTLLVVEVKKHARPDPVRDPVLQVLGYRDALASKYPGWKVRCMIVAPDFHQLTLREARRESVRCLRCDGRGGRLRSA